MAMCVKWENFSTPRSSFYAIEEAQVPQSSFLLGNARYLHGNVLAAAVDPRTELRQ